MKRVFIIPVEGKSVRDNLSGALVPAEGRYYAYGPHWIRQKKKGLVIFVDKEQSTKAVLTPKPVRKIKKTKGIS